MQIGKKSFCVIGNPVSHSLSPIMHTAAIKKYDLNAEYNFYELPSNLTQDRLRSWAVENHVTGFNVTYPFKSIAALACDELSEDSKTISAVNTIVIEHEELIGATTDGQGFLLSLGEYKLPADVAVLGAGGAASSIILALSKLDTVNEISVYVRNLVKAKEALQSLSKKIQIKEISEYVDQKLIINATPLGMGNNLDQSPIKTTQYSEAFIYDTIYHPHKTRLLLEAEAKGCRTQNGLGMLAGQAVEAFKLFFPDVISQDIGQKECYDLMLSTAEKKLRE